MSITIPIGLKTIFLTAHFGKTDEAQLPDLHSFAQADAALREMCRALDRGDSEFVHAVMIFADVFIWSTNILIQRGLMESANFVQRAVKADWEFNAGVRPDWWPVSPEADRMWNVHYEEDRANGRAELARMRLDRYDLYPLVLTPLPPRDRHPDRARERFSHTE